MNIHHLNIGIIHSLVGKNDGVSIVIDQTVNAMVEHLGMELGNIYFLAAHTSPRFNALTDDVFWHKNEIHKTIINTFSKEPPEGLDEMIHEKALYAKEVIKKWVDKNDIDLVISHNTSHPYNFITAVALGYYFEELSSEGIIWPKQLVWWHDSYMERAQFYNPNHVVKKYMKYLPGTNVDGIVFINKAQMEMARMVFQKYNSGRINLFFNQRAVIIPNTSSINWNWTDNEWLQDQAVFPPQDNYNDTFFQDVGVIDALDKEGCNMDDAVILLQHTRVVPRKKIEVAIEFAFRLEKRFNAAAQKRCIIVLVSGHSGDEEVAYKEFLWDYYHKMKSANLQSHVILIFGEAIILSHRDIIVDHKYYKFAEIPEIIASKNGLATYFSEIEGFGNNLLEVITSGLPAVINRYDVYKTDIEPLGFNLPAIDNCLLTDGLIDVSYRILTDRLFCNQMVKHNLEVIFRNLDHRIIAEKLKPLLINIFTKIVN
jgi:mannosylglucosylglycerate synthase